MIGKINEARFCKSDDCNESFIVDIDSDKEYCDKCILSFIV